jgi:DNA-directed RNA polymerase subunit RPC12/RpoP
VRKYICDNCGKETVENDFILLVVLSHDRTEELDEIGEYCSDCKAKIEARIKEGVN